MLKFHLNSNSNFMLSDVFFKNLIISEVSRKSITLSYLMILFDLTYIRAEIMNEKYFDFF